MRQTTITCDNCDKEIHYSSFNKQDFKDSYPKILEIIEEECRKQEVYIIDSDDEDLCSLECFLEVANNLLKGSKK